MKPVWSSPYTWNCHCGLFAKVNDKAFHFLAICTPTEYWLLINSIHRYDRGWQRHQHFPRHTLTHLSTAQKKFNCSSIIFIRASKILSLHLLHYTIGNQWSVGKTWNLVTNSQETVPSHAPKLIFILCDYWLKSLGLNAPHQGVILQPTMHLSQNRWPACYKNIQLCPNWKIENFQKGNPGKSHTVKNRHAYQ